jgi:hypothetical protein
MLTARIAAAREAQEALLDRVALTLAQAHPEKVEPASTPAQTIDPADALKTAGELGAIDG